VAPPFFNKKQKDPAGEEGLAQALASRTPPFIFLVG
jgi:hypothetical protein